MNMADLPKIEDEDRDDERLTEIVSYLDGELDDTQMLEIERKLIQDPGMRSHADILSRTWALLDDLDEVSASQRFTQATLATVSAESAKRDETRPAYRFKSFLSFLSTYKVVPCFLLGLVGGFAGLAVSGRLAETRHKNPAFNINNALLENFDLLQHLDSYLIVPDSQSLRKLPFPAEESSTKTGGQE
jgi:anti-sigma factor RsiW